METLSTRAVSRLSGASYRQLDNWDRTNVLKPVTEARGTGSVREYGPDQAFHARVAFVLQQLGASLDGVVTRVVEQLPTVAGHDLCAVLSDGRVLPLYQLPRDVEAAWLIDLAAARRYVDDRRDS